MKAAAITQRCNLLRIDLDAEDGRREPVRRKKDMQEFPALDRKYRGRRRPGRAV